MHQLALTVTDAFGKSTTAASSVDVHNTRTGVLHTDETWSGEHRLYSRVVVPEGITLLIADATVVVIDAAPGETSLDHELRVAGALRIAGSGQGVTILSAAAEPGSWQGIVVTSTAAIEGATVRHAVRGVAVHPAAGAVSITAGSFNTNIVGIHVYAGGAVIDSVHFSNNRWYADGGGQLQVRNSLFSGNGRDYYDSRQTVLTVAQLNALPGNGGNRSE